MKIQYFKVLVFNLIHILQLTLRRNNNIYQLHKNYKQMQANNTYYRYNFQPDYIELNQKIQSLTKQAQNSSLNINEFQPQYLIDNIEHQIQNNDLGFYPSKIYQKSATIQQLNESIKKGPNELCPGCGEQIKKFNLCEFCAEMFCKNCCWRKRIVPFNIKENDQKSCCEECHSKFIKLFNNEKFYAEKQLLGKVIQFTKQKYEKAHEKKMKLDEDYNQIQSIKRNQKIKENALLKQIKDMERKMKQAEEELKRKKQEKEKKRLQQEAIKKLEQEERRLIQEKEKEQRRKRQEDKKKQRKQEEIQPIVGQQKSQEIVKPEQIKVQKVQIKAEEKKAQEKKFEEKVEEKEESIVVSTQKQKESSKNEEEKQIRKEEVTNESQKQKDSENESGPAINVKEMSLNELLSASIPVSPQRLSRKDSKRESKQVTERMSVKNQNSYIDTESEKSEQDILNQKNDILRNSSLITSKTQQNQAAFIQNKKCSCNIM